MKGVVGVYSHEDATVKALYNLYGVNSRGQESAGMSVAGDYSLRTWKGKGLVSGVFNENFKSFVHPTDYVAVGAVSSEDADISIPPIEVETEKYKMSFAIDGHLSGGAKYQESFIKFWLENRVERPSMDSMAELMKELENNLDMAYYCLVAAVYHKNDGNGGGGGAVGDRGAMEGGGYPELYVARDRRGIRPLHVAKNDDEVFITSESSPLDVLGVKLTERRDVIPGSLIKINDEGLEEEQVFEPKRAHCAFEWVYFARPDSVIEGKTVHSVRNRLGHALVETHNLKTEYGLDKGLNECPQQDLVVIPVPDSGRSVFVGVTEGLDVTGNEGVIKNAYFGRTYIIDDPEFRQIASDLKHNIIREVVEGKKVIITDDSIVRGTVSESIAKNLLKAGAAEVEFLVSYAPIFHPCFSDPEDKPLAAAAYKGKNIFEIGDLVASNLPSIDKVRYNSIENVVNAIGLSECELCTMCITGKNQFDGE